MWQGKYSAHEKLGAAAGITVNCGLRRHIHPLRYSPRLPGRGTPRRRRDPPLRPSVASRRRRPEPAADRLGRAQGQDQRRRGLLGEEIGKRPPQRSTSGATGASSRPRRGTATIDRGRATERATRRAPGSWRAAAGAEKKSAAPYRQKLPYASLVMNDSAVVTAIVLPPRVRCLKTRLLQIDGVVKIAVPADHEAIEYAGAKMGRDACCERRRTLLPIHDLAIVPAMRVCRSNRQPLCSCVAPRDGAASTSGFDEFIAPRGKVNPQATAHARVAHHAPCRLDVANAMSEEPAGSSADGPWTAPGSQEPA
jgi:hypothetical protein